MKRLCGVVLHNEGWVVNSYGFERHLPTGRLSPKLDELQRWQIDEIILLAIKGKDAALPALDLLSGVSRDRLHTPLSVGGGIEDLEAAERCFESGADRVVLGASVRRSPKSIESIAGKFGIQAVLPSLPVCSFNASFVAFHPETKALGPAVEELSSIPSDWPGEILLQDVRADGALRAFDLQLLLAVKDVWPKASFICCGGLRSGAVIPSLLTQEKVSAVGLGNLLGQKEGIVARLKGEAAGSVRSFQPR